MSITKVFDSLLRIIYYSIINTWNVFKEISMALVAPSILSADFSCLKDDIRKAENAGADWIHVDVMDGHFVPNITIGPVVVEHLRRHTQLPLDVHLMIEKPERYIEAFRQAGADILTVHQETCPHLHRTLDFIRQTGAKAGVSINPATPPETLNYALDAADLILVMSVNPGFGGQKFIDESLKKIRTLAEMTRNKKVLIEVDGGINETTGARAVANGAHVLVAGSYIFHAQDIKSAIQSLKTLDRKTLSV